MDSEKFYFTGIPCKRGHVTKRYNSTKQCWQCISDRYSENAADKKAAASQYHHDGGGKEKRKDRDSRNLVSLAAKKRAYRLKNREKVNESKRSWADANKEKVSAINKAWRTSPSGRIKKNLASLAYKARKPWAVAARSMIHCLLSRIGREKSSKRIHILGYDENQLKQRLELNFKPGMSWANYGQWHIDHTKPVNAFVKQGITDPKVINSLCNLRPMWAIDNLRKNAKWLNTK
jgi:hypothetical protein